MSASSISTESRLREARKSTSASLRPLFDAVIDFGCALTVTLQGENAEIDAPPPGRPVISLVTDDPGQSLGPTGFHPTVAKIFRASRAAVIVASQPDATVFAVAASVAALERRNVVIVECDVEQEPQ
jgi:hypothetical protein